MKIILKNKYCVEETGTDSWTKQLDQPGQHADGIDVVVNTQLRFQRMKGMGASFSEIGAKALFSLGEEERGQVMADLFSDEGAAFNYCRMPIGASDFALNAYSLNDTPEDLEMKHFSVERDDGCLIPFIKEAQKYCPQLKIHASPWSPPCWMKDNGLMELGGSLRDEDAVYKAYALYFVKFVQEYAKRGITINRIMMQNETDAISGYTSNLMEPWQIIKFTCNYLYPAFMAAGLNTELWAGTFRTFLDFPSHECAADPVFRSCVAGFAFQYSVPAQIHSFRQLYPDIPIMHTESLCQDSRNNDTQAANLFVDFIQYMNYGVDVFSYWNMILDGPSQSSWNWKQNSLIRIIEETQEVIYNPDYYVMKMLSRAIRSGAVRVNVLCSSRPVTAFTDITEKELVILIPNLIGETTNMKLRINKEFRFKLTLEPDSLNVIRLIKTEEGYRLAEA